MKMAPVFSNRRTAGIKEIPFAKYHAAGNDFIVLSAADLTSPGRTGPARSGKLAALARTILDRHTGVGADGLFIVWPAAERQHQAAVRIFNADGSEAEMSGNGIRCAAAWLLERNPKLKQLKIETAAGIRTAEPVRRRRDELIFRVGMGEPILDGKRIPFRAEGAATPITRYPLSTSRGTLETTVTSMGNPHCSTFINRFDELDWRSLGREIETHPLFPNRTNVEFIRVLGCSEIEVRFWERGVGETASSGTGSCAAAVSSVLNGFAARRLKVYAEGGKLDVEWSESGQVFLTGPVRRIAVGKFDYHQSGSDRKSSSAAGRARTGRRAHEPQ